MLSFLGTTWKGRFFSGFLIWPGLPAVEFADKYVVVEQPCLFAFFLIKFPVLARRVFRMPNKRLSSKAPARFPHRVNPSRI